MLRDALQRRGLQLHLSKCKVQTNRTDWNIQGEVQIAHDFALNLLAEGECLEVLGTSLSLDGVTKNEADNRIAIGWRKFWAMRRLLLNGKVSAKKRLRLFDATVEVQFFMALMLGRHGWRNCEKSARLKTGCCENFALLLDVLMSPG